MLEKWKIILVQAGPCTENVAENRAALMALTAAALKESPADLVVYPELGTLPYFCVTEETELFDWAESLEGPTIQFFSKLARKFRVNMIVPLFERGSVSGVFYNSAVVLDRKGQIVVGHLPDGRPVSAYRKVHISAHFDYLPHINEKYYFRGGPGFPVFNIDGLRLGCLICYDRSFPESWRVLALAGANLVAMISASYAGRRAESFFSELQTAAVQNGLFCVSVNKGGEETFRGHRMPFFGLSCAIDPFGKLISQGRKEQGSHIVRAELDFSLSESHGRRYHYMRDRRPELYNSVIGEGRLTHSTTSGETE